MKKAIFTIMLIMIGSVLLGCTIEKPTGKEMITPFFPEVSYEGESKVGNEILAKVIVKVNPKYDLSHNPFHKIDWDNVTYEISDPDSFQIDYSNIEIFNEGKKVTINMPIKILKDGRGRIILNTPQIPSGIHLVIETEGYTKEKEMPEGWEEYCENVTKKGYGCVIPASLKD